ncbi:hypothetical protein VNO77_21397 [Canavalia gladiata]|uniref:Uncharacterized protein n=1 Tax=Canavalia gladiata TaxID=3824 RepID=A0AAN9LVM1_CANGL
MYQPTRIRRESGSEEEGAHKIVRYSHEGGNMQSGIIFPCCLWHKRQPHKFLNFILNVTKQTPAHMGFVGMKETTAKTKALLKYQTNQMGTFNTWAEVFDIVHPSMVEIKIDMLVPTYFESVGICPSPTG